MKAVIFAGGLGTRFSEKTQYMPKPMIEVGGIYKLKKLNLPYIHNDNDSYEILYEIYRGGGRGVYIQ